MTPPGPLSPILTATPGVRPGSLLEEGELKSVSLP